MSEVKRITVVGSINSDVTAYVREFPAHNQTVLARESTLTVGGKGLNQAVAAACAGAEVTLIACVGDDVFGTMAQTYLKDKQVGISAVRQVAATASGTANIMVSEGGDNMIAVAMGANACLSPEDIQRHKALIEASDVLIVQLEVPEETVREALKVARDAGVISILNPAPALGSAGELLRLADIVTPNETETQEIANIYPGNPGDAAEAAEKLKQKGARNIVITMGSAGYFYDLEGEARFVPARKVEALDPTGAGDVFNGVLAVALAKGKHSVLAAQYAAAAGALSVMRPGAEGAAPSWQEVETYLGGAGRI
ncbi:ribokinase [Paremcibacter congregatus]|uniref:ribokinase n=1 Tax=Paremcibacter congregatus TaxID=2043170 RepID=UPI0013FDD582|nr:ribokinase [Paremcibacter congregatus]